MENKKPQGVTKTEEYQTEKNKKDAGNNQWTSYNSSMAFTDDRERRDGPGGEDKKA